MEYVVLLNQTWRSITATKRWEKRGEWSMLCCRKPARRKCQASNYLLPWRSSRPWKAPSVKSTTCCASQNASIYDQGDTWTLREPSELERHSRGHSQRRGNASRASSYHCEDSWSAWAARRRKQTHCEIPESRFMVHAAAILDVNSDSQMDSAIRMA